MYKNEHIVGEAIKIVLDDENTPLKREDLFILTKVWIDEVEDVEAAMKRSLARLGLDYVDLYLMHWPIAVRTIKPPSEGKKGEYEKIKLPIHKIWPQMEALVEKGYSKSIGVSNFSV